MYWGLDATILSWAGYLGVAFYIGSYGALQAGLIRGAGYLYAALNLVAASLVLVSLWQNFNASAAAIQVFWIAISMIGMIRIYYLSRRVRFTEEERRFREITLPDMPAPMARRLLDRGVWSDQAEGSVLTEEGQPVTHLHFLSEGAADVIAGGQRITTLSEGLVGEMNVLKDGPASATVRVSRPSRVLTIPGESLRALCRTDAEFRLHIEQWLRDSVHQKLVAANARLSQQGAS
jgi:CRP-like cAMP-binding protein